MSEAAAKSYLDAIGTASRAPTWFSTCASRRPSSTSRTCSTQAVSQFLAGELTTQETMQQITDGWNAITDKLAATSSSRRTTPALASSDSPIDIESEGPIPARIGPGPRRARPSCPPSASRAARKGRPGGSSSGRPFWSSCACRSSRWSRRWSCPSRTSCSRRARIEIDFVGLSNFQTLLFGTRAEPLPGRAPGPDAARLGDHGGRDRGHDVALRAGRPERATRAVRPRRPADRRASSSSASVAARPEHRSARAVGRAR